MGIMEVLGELNKRIIGDKTGIIRPGQMRACGTHLLQLFLVAVIYNGYHPLNCIPTRVRGC